MNLFDVYHVYRGLVLGAQIDKNQVRSNGAGLAGDLTNESKNFPGCSPSGDNVIGRSCNINSPMVYPLCRGIDVSLPNFCDLYP